jgi:hypothetical protein
VRRPRGRAPATSRNRARPRDYDTTVALLRQQQEIMTQMVEQQQRTNTVIELLATRLVQVPAAEARAPTPPPPSPAPPGHETGGSCRATTYSRTSTGPGSPARSSGLASHCTCNGHDVQLLQVWTRRTQSNTWRSMNGTLRTPKYLLRRRCRRQFDVSTKHRLDGRNSTRVSGNAFQDFARSF